MSVLWIEDGRCDRKEAVDANSDKVENWRGATDDVHGQVEVTYVGGKMPVAPVELEKWGILTFVDFLY